MQEARVAASRGRSAGVKSRVSKFVAAGVAVVGATAIAVNPVAPTPPELHHAQVNLAAAENPLAVLQNFWTETTTNLQLLQINASNSANGLTSALGTANPLAELLAVIQGNISDPTALLTRLQNFQATYGDDLQIAFQGRDDDPATPANETYQGLFERIQEAVDLFGPTLQDIFTHEPSNLGTGATGAAINPPGVFTQALFEANYYFVLNLLDVFRPLAGATPSGVIPYFSIFADLIGGEPAGGYDGALPGVSRLDNLLNVLNEQNIVRAITGPFQTAAFQIAAVLDDSLASLQAGDPLSAVVHLINLPVKTLNAFVNGFTPSFSTGEWPNLIDPLAPAGIVKYGLVDLPNLIISALGGTPPTQVTTLPTPAPAAPVSTFAAFSGETVTEAAPASPAEGTEKQTVVVEPEVAPVVDKVEVTVETPSAALGSETETAPAAATPAVTGAEDAEATQNVVRDSFKAEPGTTGDAASGGGDNAPETVEAAPADTTAGAAEGGAGEGGEAGGDAGGEGGGDE